MLNLKRRDSTLQIKRQNSSEEKVLTSHGTSDTALLVCYLIVELNHSIDIFFRHRCKISEGGLRSLFADALPPPYQNKPPGSVVSRAPSELGTDSLM